MEHLWPDGKTRCRWIAPGDALYCKYHDFEWGVPLHDERTLFELLSLEGFQAGLSWRTILHRRQAFRDAFENFELERVLHFGAEKIAELLQNDAIIRNRRKVEAVVRNARAFCSIQEACGSFDSFLWSYVGGKPIHNTYSSPDEVPCSTPLSDRLSSDLKKRGFTFTGTKIVYAYMQSAGLVNDHTTDCFLHGISSFPRGVKLSLISNIYK